MPREKKMPTGRHTKSTAGTTAQATAATQVAGRAPKAPLRLGQGNGAIGTPVALQEEVEYGLVLLNNF